MTPIQIIKEDGSYEQFEPAKLEKSLLRVGAQPTVAEKIVRTIVEELEKGVCDPSAPSGDVCSVDALYKRAFEMLKHMSAVAAARYSLRRSIMQFGPTGFPFEKYIAELFKARGYRTLTDQQVFGGCVPHEVDLVAWKKDELIMAEVKYHNEPSGKSDTKVTLYVKARYDDLKDVVFRYDGMPDRKIDTWLLITNTKFTDTAITYAKCKGLQLLSWSYPEDENLFTMIESAKLHPITCLLSLSASEKQELIQNNIVLCKSIYEDRSLLTKLGYSEKEIYIIMEEISQVINLVPRDR